MAKPRRTPAPERVRSLRLSAINYALLAAGLASIAAGYVLLSGGSTVGAPLLLVLGYAVLIPLGIIK